MSVSRDEVPEIVQEWIGQLLNPEFVDLIRACPDRPVDVRLSASKGRVKRLPTITIGGSGSFEEA